MMKKLIIITMMSLLSIVLINQSIYAEAVFVNEPSINTGGLWHVEDGNRAYVFMRYTDGSTVIETGSSSNEAHPEYDLSLYTKWYGTADDLKFPNTSLYNDYDSISNPDPNIYDRFVVEIIPHMEAPAAVIPAVKIYDGAAANIEIQLHDYDDFHLWPSDWSHIILSVDGEEALSSRSLRQAFIDIYDLDIEPNPNGEDLFFGVRMYWEKSDSVDPIDPSVPVEVEPGVFDDPWNALPDTTGSPVHPLGDWGTLTDISISNQVVSFNINYLGTIYPVLPFTVDGDLDFISKSNDVLYYTDPDTGDRILYFNFGETLDSAILAARTFSEVNVWKGEALWNLTQNEIKVTGVLKVYNYIAEVDDDGNVFSYFYMPDVPMDNLISVSSVLAYRYYDEEYFGVFGDLEPGEIQYKAVAAVRGETYSENPPWVEVTYKTAYITGVVATAAIVAGVVVPVYGWAIVGASFLVGTSFLVADVNEWFAYDVDQIQHVIPSVSLTNEINTYISGFNEGDQFTADTDKLYKLHLATLNDYDDIEIMDELSNVTQVVWETDGEIFVVNEDYIIDYWGGPGTEIPIDSIGNDEFEIILWVAVGVVGLYIFTKMKLDKKPGLMVLLIGLALYYLYKLGLL